MCSLVPRPASFSKDFPSCNQKSHGPTRLLYVHMGHPGRILGCPRGSSGQCGGLCVHGTSREDPGMF